MDDDKMRELMIDHIDGKLTGELSNFVKSHISKNPVAKKEYDQLKELLSIMAMEEYLEVPGEGKSEFLQMISEQKVLADQQPELKRKVNPVFLAPKYLRGIAAAVALLLIGYWGGSVINSNSTEMEALKAEMRETKELIMLSMMKENSASERMKGVLASYEIIEADNEILDVLIQTMNFDDNINVRVAAVEALGNFADNEKVKDALIQSLVVQEYPAVQLKLIMLMVRLEEKRAIDNLQEIIQNDEVISIVKDEAQFGIFKLM